VSYSAIHGNDSCRGLALRGAVARLSRFMTRMAVAAAWVWIALAQPAGVYARADAGRACCAAPDAGRAGGVAPDADRAGGVAPDAARTGLPAMCGETLINTVLAAHSGNAVPGAAALPLEDGPVAWCLTPDDPRCSRRDASSLPDASQAPLPLNASRELPLPSPRCEEIAAPYTEAFGALRAGRHTRVERPPR
jgi:hypothetical protein